MEYMKFEEVLPALREGKKIRRTTDFWKNFIYCYQLIDNQLWDGAEEWIDAIDVLDLLADDWEIVKEKKKVKLRDLTEEQFDKWILKNCQKNNECKNCVFNRVNCINTSAYSSIKAKSLFSDKFLDQEIEIEE